MARQYVLYKTGNLEAKPGWMDDFYEIYNYKICSVQDDYQDLRIQYDHLNAEEINSTLARGCIYADPKSIYDGATLTSNTISIKKGTTVEDEFPQLLDSGEAAGNKTVVTLNDAQKTAGVNFNKAVFKKILKDRYNQHMRGLNVYSEVEKASFAGQLAEAKAHVADNSASTPMLSAISTARGLTVAALRDKVISKSAAYDLTLANLLKAQQIHEDRIDALDTLAKCATYRHTYLGIGMGTAQKTAESVDSTPLTTKITF
jgi:hypothetical protein